MRNAHRGNQALPACGPGSWYPWHRPAPRCARPVTARVRIDSPYASGPDGPLARRLTGRADAQQTADGAGQLRAIEGVEVDPPPALFLQHAAFLAGHVSGHQLAGLRIVVHALEEVREPGRHA